ncbi:hypothetical protein VTO42DRAFT_6891 [Malbranchea cinnamomea]
MPSPAGHGGVRELQQPLMISHQMMPTQLQPHFSPGGLSVAYSGNQHGTKRRRIDDGHGASSDENAPGLSLAMLSETTQTDESQSADVLLSAQTDPPSQQQPPVQHDYQPQTHHQPHPPPPPPPPPRLQHHHHRLPSRATIAGAQGSDTELTSSARAPGPQSLVGQPGMPDPAPRPRGPKLKFTPDEDGLLIELKENRNLTWKQIADFFPGRTSGTLQVRYCTKLKAKATVWTDEAVQRLRNAIRDYENDRWRIIASKVGHGFSPAACREKAAEL